MVGGSLRVISRNPNVPAGAEMTHYLLYFSMVINLVMIVVGAVNFKKGVWWVVMCVVGVVGFIGSLVWDSQLIKKYERNN